MRTVDLIGMGSRNLWRRKLRTLLTVIGVVVGTTAIVVMVSLGLGMNQRLEDTIAQMGDLTIITLNEYGYSKDKDGKDINGQNTLNQELVEKIEKLDGVVAVMPYLQCYRYNFKMQAGKRFESWMNVTGIPPKSLEAFGFKLDKGELPNADDKNFVLFGSDTIYNFYNPNRIVRDWYKDNYNPDGTRKPPKVDIMKEKLQIYGTVWSDQGEKQSKKRNLTKVGILKQDDKNWELTYNTFMDIDLVRSMILEMEKMDKVKAADSQANKYQQIKIKTANIDATEKVQQQIKDMGITTYGLSDIRKQMQDQQAATQYILAGIGAMSLLVAAIGIANTMVMSIYERTREIGVMKVLGCQLSAIRGMFLFEASMIGFIGGILGVGLSLAASYAFNNVKALQGALGGNNPFGNPETASALSIIPPWLILVAIIFSTLVGLISGYLPARRATKVSALEAIKNDA